MLSRVQCLQVNCDFHNAYWIYCLSSVLMPPLLNIYLNQVSVIGVNFILQATKEKLEIQEEHRRQANLIHRMMKRVKVLEQQIQDVHEQNIKNTQVCFSQERSLPFAQTFLLIHSLHSTIYIWNRLYDLLSWIIAARIILFLMSTFYS